MIIIPLEEAAFYDKINSIVKTAVQSEMQGLIHPEKSDELLSRRDTAKLLEISLPTLHNYTNAGMLHAYKIGSRVLYKREEVISGLNKIKKFKKA